MRSPEFGDELFRSDSGHLCVNWTLDLAWRGHVYRPENAQQRELWLARPGRRPRRQIGAADFADPLFQRQRSVNTLHLGVIAAYPMPRLDPNRLP